MVLRLGRTLNMKPTHAANFSANMKTSLSKPTKITTAKNNIPVTSGSAISRYRGIRWRGGKWVTEIRVPKKNKRLWLGTYLTPEMAATAYDVAALALKGEEAIVNFPSAVRSYPLPCSNSETHIRKAASVAAAAVAPVVVATAAAVVATNTVVATATNKVKENEKNEEGVCDVVGHLTTTFVDEEELFNMPNLLVDMARGMMLDPPPMGSPRLDESLEIYIGESLWSYKL